jgi:hypothetical protein
MGEPRAITFKEVEKAGGNIDTWHKIGDITGAGHVPVNTYGEASIDLTEASDSVRGRVDKLLAGEKEEAAEAEETKKRGKQ